MIITCDNCKEKTFKRIDSFINHLWIKHDVHIKELWKMEAQGIEIKGTYYCEDCSKWIRTRLSLHKHLSTKHDVVSWYQRRLGKRRMVYLDGLIHQSNRTKEAKEN